MADKVSNRFSASCVEEVITFPPFEFIATYVETYVKNEY